MNTQTIGKKAFNLQSLVDNGFDVPSFKVVEPGLFWDLLEGSRFKAFASINDNGVIDSGTTFEDMRALFDEIIDDSQFRNMLGEELSDISLEGRSFAVRSSSLEEDGEISSYAGQFDSFLKVRRPSLSLFVLKVWRSAYSERIEEYRKLKGVEGLATMPSVIIQTMVKATTAGVAFSACPVSGDRDKIIVNSVDGLADRLVDGEASGAFYEYRGSRLISRENEEAGYLNHFQRRKLLRAVKSIETLFGKPQDIEWAFSGNRLFILQSRDITTLNQVKEVRRVDIFDNSNIGESYPGVTTPLTFSFARVAYENVYHQFCLLMGVPAKTIEANSQIFPQMLGYVNGRIYYNLLNWYRLLSLFPGYKANQKFME